MVMRSECALVLGDTQLKNNGSEQPLQECIRKKIYRSKKFDEVLEN